MKKRFFAIAIIVILVFSLTSCGNKTFERDNGFSIELPIHYIVLSDLTELVNPDVQNSSDVTVFTSYVEGLTISVVKTDYINYGEEPLSNFDRAVVKARDYQDDYPDTSVYELLNGIPAVTHKLTSNQTVIMFFFCTDDANWSVGVSSINEDVVESKKDTIISYASSVEVH